MVTLIEAKGTETLFDLWKNANEVCSKSHKVSNLILSGTFAFSELNSDFVNAHKQYAEDLQNPEKPAHLVLNHGEFFDKYKTTHNKSALDYVIEELKIKADSHRACISLYDMSTLISSDDKSIPSFMVMQAGMSDDLSQLSLTSYFRALEVSKYLPRNIAESCLVAEKLQSAFSFKFKELSITIHACNAYVKENYSCHEKAELDMLGEAEIMMQVMMANTSRSWIKKMLNNKKDINESRIIPDGINHLVQSIEMANNRPKQATELVYDGSLISLLKSISTKIKEHNEIVYSSTYAVQAKEKYNEIKSELNKAINTL